MKIDYFSRYCLALLCLLIFPALVYADSRRIGAISSFSSPDSAEMSVTMKDVKTSEIFEVLIKDSLTKDRFKDGVFNVGDEVRVKYAEKNGKNESMLFRKTSGEHTPRKGSNSVTQGSNPSKGNASASSTSSSSSGLTNRHAVTSSNVAADEGIFSNPSLNDWCTMTRMSIWKKRVGDNSADLYEKAKSMALNFLHGMSFSDEFEREAKKIQLRDAVYEKLKSCKNFTDKVTLKIGYTYRKDDYKFNDGELLMQVGKELAKYPHYSKYLMNLKHSKMYGTMFASKAQLQDNEPRVEDILSTSIGPDGLSEPIVDFYNIGSSVRDLYSELNVPITRDTTAGFRKKFKFSGYDDIKVPMSIDEVKQLRDLSSKSKVTAEINYMISSIESNAWVMDVCIHPNKITFMNASGKVLFEKKEGLSSPCR